MDDIQSSGEASVEAEAEVRDIHSWIESMASAVVEIEARFALIKEGMQSIYELAQQQENLNIQAEAEVPHAAMNASLNTEKLTPTAKTLISQLEGRPLDPARFEEFLLEKSFGKPRPPVLPIVRSYTSSGSASEIREVVQQLNSFYSGLRQAHRHYKEVHRLDENLGRRIERLVENIKRELAQEEQNGMHQASMRSFVGPRNET